MPYDLNNIAHEFYEELKPLFVNYLHKNFRIDYDTIYDIYNDVWLDVRENIAAGRVHPGTHWKAYILRMGFNKANKLAEHRSHEPELVLDDETFNREAFEKKYNAEKEAEESGYGNPQLLDVLNAELCYIPDPCNTVLQMYYYEHLSMREIADCMNYSGARSAITIMDRCRKNLKARVANTARSLGILEEND